MDHDFGVDSGKISALMSVISAQKAKAVDALEQFHGLVTSMGTDAWNGEQSILAIQEAENLYQEAKKINEVLDAFYSALETTQRNTGELANTISGYTNNLLS